MLIDAHMHARTARSSSNRIRHMIPALKDHTRPRDVAILDVCRRRAHNITPQRRRSLAKVAAGSALVKRSAMLLAESSLISQQDGVPDEANGNAFVSVQIPQR